jgi:hypothetical protein
MLPLRTVPRPNIFRKTFSLGALSIFVIVLLTMAACGSSPSYSTSSYSPQPPKWKNVILSGEEDALLEGTIWTTPNSILSDTWEFRNNGKLINRYISSNGSEITITSNTWQREGDNVKVVLYSGDTFLEGKYYPQTQRIMLNGEDSSGKTWAETWVPLQGTSIAPVRSTVSQANNVQPSAPAQTAPAQPRPSTPTLQTGTYAANRTNITMHLNLGQVIAYSGRDPVAFGTYTISGNQLAVTFDARTSATGVGGSLRGNTYIYTITSNATFSGNGEEWIRTGY